MAVGAGLALAALAEGLIVAKDGAQIARATDSFAVRRSRVRDVEAGRSGPRPVGCIRGGYLFPVPYTNRLFLSNSGNVYQFDRDSHVFGPYTAGPNRSGIKAVGQNPGASTTCLMKATNAPGPSPRSWSSDTILFDVPGGQPATVKRVRPGAQFYKARWAAPTP